MAPILPSSKNALSSAVLVHNRRTLSSLGSPTGSLLTKKIKCERFTKMYESFFNFTETPFNLTPDPRFFFSSPKHEDAFSQNLYGIQERKGFIVLTGEVGTGKTTLCRLLL